MSPAPTRVLRSPRTGKLRIECTVCRKIAYPSRELAMDGALSRTEAYLSECGHWHLATKLRRPGSANRRTETTP